MCCRISLGKSVVNIVTFKYMPSTPRSRLLFVAAAVLLIWRFSSFAGRRSTAEIDRIQTRATLLQRPQPTFIPQAGQPAELYPTVNEALAQQVYEFADDSGEAEEGEGGEEELEEEAQADQEEARAGFNQPGSAGAVNPGHVAPNTEELCTRPWNQIDPLSLEVPLFPSLTYSLPQHSSRSCHYQITNSEISGLP